MLPQSQAKHWYIFILNITQGEDDHTQVNLPTPISLTTRSITAYLISYRKTSTPHRYSPFQPPPLTPFLLVFLLANHCNVFILNSIQSKALSLSLTLGQSVFATPKIRISQFMKYFVYNYIYIYICTSS